ALGMKEDRRAQRPQPPGAPDPDQAKIPAHGQRRDGALISRLTRIQDDFVKHHVKRSNQYASTAAWPEASSTRTSQRLPLLRRSTSPMTHACSPARLSALTILSALRASTAQTIPIPILKVWA